MYTVTNEADIVSNVLTTTDVQNKMRFSNVNTTTHIYLPIGNYGTGNYIIRPYVDPTVSSPVQIRGGGNAGVQLWVGNEPFAAGIAPKNCFNSVVPGSTFTVSTFFPLYALGTILKNSAGEICVTTQQGTYTYQTCSGSCSTGTDLDAGTRDVSVGKNTSGGGDPNLLKWDIIPVDWVTNGYYIRSRGTDKRIVGMGNSGIKYDAGFVQKPYLKWGSYIGRVRDTGYVESDSFDNAILSFVSGMAIGVTLGAVNPDLADKNDPNNIFFTSFPPQFQTYYSKSPLPAGERVYTNLQTLPSQGPGGTKYDDKDYIFIIDPA
jgi:hypothetical protein